MVEPAPAREFEIWPLHITLVPWFHSDNDQELDKVLQKVASRHKALKVYTGKVEQWGKKEKFEVQKLEDPGSLHRLHWDVYQSLEKNGFHIHQKDFLREKFAPHLALRNRYQKGHAFKEGSGLEVKNFALINQTRLKVTGRMIKSVTKEYALSN